MTTTTATPTQPGPLASTLSQTGREALVNAVDVELETYLGKTRMSIGEVKALGEGAIVRLDSALNALVELRLNGSTIALGELVAVGDKFGVRITALTP
jgi:flagellar motor switch protein FliN